MNQRSLAEDPPSPSRRFVRVIGTTAGALVTAVLLVLPSVATGFPADCVDADGDGYGIFPSIACPGGTEVDCDDTNGAIYPGAPEICDGFNNDCYNPDWPYLDYWSQRVVTTSADGASSVYAADLDGDTDMDMVAAASNVGTLAWYENTAGDGSAWTEREISPSVYDARSVFAADVDGDLDQDVLAVSYWYDRVAWYENTEGDGSNWIEREISTSFPGPRSVFAADVDGDGDVDVLSASYYTYDDDRVVWYENSLGDGSTWVERVISTTTLGPIAVFAADVDGDADLDVLSASVDDDKIAWYENVAGNGSIWTEHVVSTSAMNARSVFAADVDGDDDLDLLSASWYPEPDTIEWYENTAGDGSNWTERTISTSGYGGTAVFAADVDGDDDIDVLALFHGSDEIVWYESTTGDGLSWAERVIRTSANGLLSVFVADVDGDGDLDVASASENDDKIAWYFLHSLEEDDDGDGRAECMGDCDDDDPNNWISCSTCVDLDGDSYYVECDAYATILGPDCDDTEPYCALDCIDDDTDGRCRDVDCDDIDPNNWESCSTCGDADGDSYYAHCDAYLTFDGPDCDDTDGDVYPGAEQLCDGANNDCDHVHWPLLESWSDREIATSAIEARSVVAADLDGDDDLDAVSASKVDDTIAWHENTDGDGSDWVEHVVSTSADGAESVYAADLDGDGDQDLLSASDYDDKIAWYENVVGDGSAWTEHVISTSGDGASSVIAADVDGDSDLDVVASSWRDDTITWYENWVGDGSYWVESTITTSVNGVKAVFAADVDGDSDLDVLGASSFDHTLAWYENLAGDGSAWSVWTISTSVYGVESVFAADVDGDTDLDVLAPSSNIQTISWFENTAGDGSSWTVRTISESISSVRSMVAADVDNDGHTDVLSASDYWDKIVWYRNTAGDGSAWEEREISSSTESAQSVFAADMDGDGDLDVLSAFDNAIAWHRQTGLEQDDDKDGLRDCDGDCDDANPSTYPGAPETNDGADNQCPGDEGHGLIDEIEGESGFHDPDDTAEFSWPAQPGATQYEVARFAEPDNPVNCTLFTTAQTFVIDAEEPISGAAFHYLVRALAPHTGSWGQDSAGVERTHVCP